jgi:hypothetical protein
VVGVCAETARLAVRIMDRIVKRRCSIDAPEVCPKGPSIDL